MAQVMIVDDDPAVRSVLRRMLAREGHQVTEQPDAESALASLAACRPEVIISDMYMPEMDGIEFLIHVEAVAPEVPVIAISGGGPTGTPMCATTRRSWARRPRCSSPSPTKNFTRSSRPCSGRCPGGRPRSPPGGRRPWRPPTARGNAPRCPG